MGKKKQEQTPIEKQYSEITKKSTPNSKKLSNTLKAFTVGGLICVAGEVMTYYLGKTNLSSDTIKAAVPIFLIIITAALTGLGLFGKLAKHAGAGTFVPITGFANSIVSPAMDYQSEGRVFGTGAKMFTIAGPVIAYGCSAATVFGLIYYFFIK